MIFMSPVPACVCDCLLFGVLVRFSVHVCVYVWCMRFLMFVSSFFYISCVRACVSVGVCVCVCMRFACLYVRLSCVLMWFVRFRVLLYVLFIDCHFFRFTCSSCAVRAWRAVHPIAGFGSFFLFLCVFVSAFLSVFASCVHFFCVRSYICVCMFVCVCTPECYRPVRLCLHGHGMVFSSTSLSVRCRVVLVRL